MGGRKGGKIEREGNSCQDQRSLLAKETRESALHSFNGAPTALKEHETESPQCPVDSERPVYEGRQSRTPRLARQTE